LTIIAILRKCCPAIGLPYITAQFFGGTSLLIMVGVILTHAPGGDPSHSRHYDGFLRKGKIAVVTIAPPPDVGEAVQQKAMLWLYVGVAVLIIAGMAVFVAGRISLGDGSSLLWTPCSNKGTQRN